MSSAFPASFVTPWRELLASHEAQQANDLPSYYVADWDALVTTSASKSLHVGIGYSIYTRAILPAILKAKHAVHFVTCYWAPSPTLDAFRDTLTQLAASRTCLHEGAPPLQITIGFSSMGLFQKLFHTSSRNGHVYPPSQWPKLGLPDEATLRAGAIEMTVKSLFFTPFSVMHPKYIIIDGVQAFMPSCNVSWERWFEGCIELQGDVVQRLLAFHRSVWRPPVEQDAHQQQVEVSPERSELLEATSRPVAEEDGVSPTRSLRLGLSIPVPTVLLPSPHHRNPRLSLFPLLSQSKPPMTPLNAALLTMFANANREITILSPNFTSWPVLDALLEALARGIDVRIRTSKAMMLIEQIVTAGTTTSRCLRRFVNKYQDLHSLSQPVDLEAQPLSPGRLEILYYKPLTSRKESDDEPVFSHLKMTLVDGEYLVLGSGNMDRASWWTSQELGILFYVPNFEGHALWDGVLSARTEVMYRSTGYS
ncbi:phospholipase D [Ophiocordyceps camponoti-floridani]|uniref:Phospholipase D n=1 Tax=Ophiocordyceps camponoti-floridani TaxID=2030778 RepID=A0A8H4Q857_9HYPO|nr:phospholipase D [Ophiocordyceps camponoti-floridani]